jgi:Replication initiator protein A
LETAERIEDDSMAKKANDGKDELNLAEFPLCALAHRLRPEQKTLRFEDRVWDERRQQTITRQLTITGSDAFGLPTALDDEVLLGLIQLSKVNQFADRIVRFTRYQLIQLLGWRNESKSYERLEASLNRWTGVTLYYKNAWWNKKRQCWVDEKFHVLDNVRLFQRENTGNKANEEGNHSVFIWNEVIFQSFQAGNLKSIDFDFFRELRSAVAKRLYRFLDKRFFHRRHWEFDLKEFAHEHAGLSRHYDTANLKRKLRPGIAELEQRGYLKPMPEAERFQKLCSGEWRVVFDRQRGDKPEQAPATAAAPQQPLVEALVQRGVAQSTAQSTVKQFSAERIQAQLEVFDYLIAQKDAKLPRNPPGFLISAIRGEFAPPKNYLDHQSGQRRRQESEERRQRAEQRKQEQEIAAHKKEEAQEAAIRSFGIRGQPRNAPGWRMKPLNSPRRCTARCWSAAAR